MASFYSDSTSFYSVLRPTESRLSLSCFRLEQSVRLEACHFSVGISQSGVFALRAQSGSGAGPVGTQSGFPSRAQSGFGPSRDSPVGILPSRDFSSRAPVGIPSRASRPSRAPVGISSCPVGISQSGPSRVFAQSGTGPSRRGICGSATGGSGTFLACPTQCRVGCRVSRGRAPVGFPQSGSVAQSGRACSQSGSSRDRPVGDWPQSGSSRDSPVGPSRELAPVGNAQSGFCPVGNCSVGLQSGFPSRVFRASRASVGICPVGNSLSRDLPSREFAQSGLSRDSQSGLFCQSGLSRVLSAPSRAPVGQPSTAPRPCGTRRLSPSTSRRQARRHLQ